MRWLAEVGKVKENSAAFFDPDIVTAICPVLVVDGSTYRLYGVSHYVIIASSRTDLHR